MDDQVTVHLNPPHPNPLPEGEGVDGSLPAHLSISRRDEAHPPAAGRRWNSDWLIWLALLVTVAGPFLLAGQDSGAALHYDRRLVILTPHHERIRQEIGNAFVEDWRERTGETVYLDWRTPGGSSEITLFLKSEFAGAFEYHWVNHLRRRWSQPLARAFADPRTTPDRSSPAEWEARQAFLASNVGVGVDLLFGGGSYDFQQQADAGYLVAGGAGIGLLSLRDRHPDWFTPAIYPEAVGGEPFRDRENRWMGVELATFGIVYNRDVLRRLGIDREPEQWVDLADTRLAGQVAMSDPTKSGSVAKAFELIIQQQMQQAVSRHLAADLATGAAEAAGIREGWREGLKLIQRMSANARYFTDSAAKIPLEVARADAAAGMAIESYGKATEEFVRRPDGQSRVGFVAPLGGTSLSVDPIALLRGAPEPRLATEFMEFVLSPRGQKLWAFRPGTPDGPVSTALRRLPVRRDFYSDANRPWMTEPDAQPYVQAGRFVYHSHWTAPLYGAIRFLIRVMCVETHPEQRQAWRALIDRGMPAAALAAFHDLSGFDHDDVQRRIVPILQGKDKLGEVRLARELSAAFRQRYERARRLALDGKAGS